MSNDFSTTFHFDDSGPPTERDLLPDEEFEVSISPKLLTSAYEYDVAVIGSGPAGHTAAVHAARLGGKVIMFEKEALGGLWLNAGCVPAKVYLEAGNSEAPDLRKALALKTDIVTKLTSNAARALRACRVRVEAGEASLKSPHEIVCRGRVYTASSVILCGGRRGGEPPIAGYTHPGVLTPESLFKMSELPSRLMVIGGGSEGCELAAAFAAFGSSVMLVEERTRLLRGWDEQVAEAVARALTEAGVKVYTGISVSEIADRNGNPYIITERGGVLCDKVLLAAGRAPDVSFLGALTSAFRFESGAIAVNEYLETSVPGVYAAGDITGIGSRTHTCYRMAETAAVNAMGGGKLLDLRAVPKAIYTKPEAAYVGMTEEEARESYGDELAVGYCPLSLSVKAMIAGATEGFVKVLIGRRYGEIAGVHIVGAEAAEMIAEPAALMRMEVTAYEVINDISHLHPTWTEAFAEACADALGKSIRLLRAVNQA